MKTRILVADDHELFRRGVRSLIETRKEFEVCGEASNGREAVDRALELKPHIVIMDLTMPLLSGLQATRQIVQQLPTAQVLILSIHDSEHLIREAVLAGAHGYVLKTDGGSVLLDALRAISKREPYFTPRAAQVLVQELRGSGTRRAPGDPISARERQVLTLIAEGKNSREIGAILGISPKTSDVHRANLMRKLELHSVSELVRYAIRNHLVEV